MRIAVTGASGFIGQEFIRALPSSVNMILLSRKKQEGFVETDYSVDSLIPLLKGVDIIVHLASVRGKADQYDTFMENEILIENILKAMVSSDCKRIIFMSSIAVYSDPQNLPWKEGQCASPQTFYGLSKLTGEHLCRLYAEKGIHYIIFRCGIVFGLDHTARMISNFISRASRGEQLILTGKSIAKRDFVYVKEVARALVYATEGKLPDNEIYNLGSGEAYTNLEVAEAVNCCFENMGNLKCDETTAEQVINSYMCSEKLYRTGFKKEWNLRDALKDIKDGIEIESL